MVINPPQFGNISEQLGLPDFSTSSDDWIREIFPHHSQETAEHLVALTLEHDRPPDMDHRRAASRQPIDVAHVMEFDGNDRLADERKALRNMRLERGSLGEKACADKRLAWAAGGVGFCFGGNLSGARSGPKMRRHSINAPAFELVWHQL